LPVSFRVQIVNYSISYRITHKASRVVVVVVVGYRPLFRQPLFRQPLFRQSQSQPCVEKLMNDFVSRTD